MTPAEEEPNTTKQSPRDKADCFSVITFWWLWSILRTGWKRGLKEDDAYKVLAHDHSSTLGDKLEAKWLNHLKSCAENGKTPSFRWVMFRTFAFKFIFYGLFGFMEECLLRMIQVIAIGFIIISFSQEKSKLHNTTLPQLATVTVFLTSIWFLLSFHWSMFNTHHVCTHMRLAMSSIIYRKTLRLSQATMRSFSVGQLITILSSDVYRLDMKDLHLNYLWIAPLQVLVVMYLLYVHYDFGKASLCGLGLLVIFSIFQYVMGVYLGKVRVKKMLATNKRLRIITEIINAFYNIKLFAWENAFYVRAKESRLAELKFVKKTMFLRILSSSITLVLTKMTVFITIVLFVHMDDQLDAEKVFVTLLLYEHVRTNLAHLFSNATVDLAEVSVTMHRMTEFLLLEEKFEDPARYELNELVPGNGSLGRVVFNDVSCKWHQDQSFSSLENINLDVGAGKLVAIVGPTASGKTSFLSAILGEIPVVKGQLVVQGKIGYVPQSPWLFAGSIKQNIVFGNQQNEEWYQAVLEMCGLTKDLERMADGDQTKVYGTQLSIGQKARISLARAMYLNAEIYLLDDPLSCVDPKLQRHILEKCIRGALKSKTVFLVTHQVHFLEAADDIAIMRNGKIIAKGTQTELGDKGITFSKEGDYDVELDDDIDLALTSSVVSLNRRPSIVVVQGDDSTLQMEVRMQEVPHLLPSGRSAIAINEIEDADRFVISTKLGISLFWSYVKTSSSPPLLIILIFLCLATQVTYTGSEIFLEYWVEHEEEIFKDKNHTTAEQKERLQHAYYYCAIIPTLVTLSILRSIVMFKICMDASLTLFCQLLNSMLRAKANLQDAGSGHRINRFSKDMVIIDELLPITLYEISGIIFEILGTHCTLCYSFHTSTVYVIAACILCLFHIVSVCLLYKVYHKNAATLKRLESSARSPIYAHTAKTLEGLSLIRAFHQERIFERMFDTLQDQHSSLWYLYVAMNTWMSLLVDVISLLLIAAVVTLIAFGHRKNASLDMHPATVGMALAKVIELSILMQMAVTLISDSETEMISVERVMVSSEEVEDAWEVPENKPPSYWPHEGNITFQEVTVFGAHHQPVLTDLNLVIQKGARIGIVGHSGSGKTTFLNTLFRIAEADKGDIIIDEVNIQRIGLHDLRHGLSIIPQVPYLFSGSIRNNLDPEKLYPDHELWTVLDAVNLFEVIKLKGADLDTIISEVGWQLSEGQVQLIALARVLLQKNQILCLDQATNNLDPHTVRLISRKVDEYFQKTTILSVAHSLSSLMSYDKIIVMEHGRIVDYGDPYSLTRKQGPFSILLAHLGIKNVEEITRLAKQAEVKRRQSLAQPSGNMLEQMRTLIGKKND